MSRLTRRQVKAIKSKQKTKNDAKKWHIKNHSPVTIKSSIKPSKANKGKQGQISSFNNKIKQENGKLKKTTRQLNRFIDNLKAFKCFLRHIKRLLGILLPKNIKKAFRDI